MNSSEASSSMSQSYKVFLSFRGEDTRYSFTDHLHTRLVERGYQVFRDNEGIGCGQIIRSTLQLAIQQSKVSIVVLSKNYASSKWCLDELVMIMNRHEQEGHNVLPVFYQVDPADVRNQRGSFAEAFIKHEESDTEEMKIRGEGWRLALRKVGEIKGEHVQGERYETEVIQRIFEDVGRIIDSGLKKRKYTFLVSEMVGQGFERALENIWSLLMNDEVSRIGVYGMGGIGKTTLMKHIHKQLLETPKQFPHVYWITASQDCDVFRLQNRIAKIMHLDISDEEGDIYRAAILTNEFADKGNFVLIIDDLWKEFDLEEVGLPQGGYKLMFTTRSLDVCRQMNCQEENIIKVESLSPEEAWALFEREHGTFDIEVETYAKEIVKEYSGLPLAIKTIGKNTRRIKNEVGWRDAVKKIKDPTIGKSDMDLVFPILRFSYSCLDDEISLQQCFLYCGLFPEDYLIEREELIEYLIVEGIIKSKNCRRDEVDEGLVMLDKLIDLCLLEEDASFGKVKMHDLIRDMALKILIEESSVMVQAGKELTECPDADKWEKSLVRVSLMKNNIWEIGSDDFFQPICPNLSTLLLSRNFKLAKISDCFFERLDGLKVLDLSHTGILRLPEYISNLVRLSALLLRGCHKLKHIASLAKLKALEKLDLRGSSRIEQVPHGMEFLHKLRYLDLLYCGKLKEFPAGMLPKLSRLQVLRISLRSILKGEEVGCLKKLEDLTCRFPNLAEYNKYLGFAKPLHKFRIYVKPIDKEQFDDVETVHLNILNIWNSDLRMVGDFRKLPEGIEYLRFSYCKFDAGRLSDLACVLNGADGLKEIELHRCEGVEWIASVAELSANIFSTLEHIFLYEFSNLHCLVSFEDENEKGGPLTLPFSKTFACLRTITIVRCHSIKKLFPRGLLQNLQNLEDISVLECDGLEEIVTSEANSSDYSSHFVTLLKLTNLGLSDLPSLQSIYSGKLICESLETLTLIECGMLKRIPISLPLPSIEGICVGPRNWWEHEVEWDHPDAKQILQSCVKFSAQR